MQFKPITAIIVLSLVIASLLVAGCTVTNTSNPSPTTSQNATSLYQIKTVTTNATSKTITENYTKAGYDIVTSFTVGKNQFGNDVYSGVVKDNSTSHVTQYEHNVTIEIMNSKNETVTRAAQLRNIYVKQGYYMPGNLSSGLITYSNTNDSTGTHQLLIGLCDPNMGCTPYTTFNNFTVIVDRQTKLG
jgi:hypothetical protein